MLFVQFKFDFDYDYDYQNTWIQFKKAHSNQRNGIFWQNVDNFDSIHIVHTNYWKSECFFSLSSVFVLYLDCDIKVELNLMCDWEMNGEVKEAKFDLISRQWYEISIRYIYFKENDRRLNEWKTSEAELKKKK